MLATDGATLEAEDLTTGETVACEYEDFPNHFGFFLALAGISTVKQLRENAFDIRATGRLNRLYLELRKNNPDWDEPKRRHDMNHFMARLIFCFFAESTDIFFGEGLFTATVDQMSERDASNTHEVIGADWQVAPRWNLCNAPGVDDARVAKSKVRAVGEFLASHDRVLVCTHATFRFAVDELSIEAFDDCLVAVDEFHHVSAGEDNKLGAQLAALIARDRAHIVAMTGSYFRGDAVPVLSPEDEARFETVTYTYYEQLNGYEHLKSLEIGYFFYNGSYVDHIMKVLDPALKTIVHIPSVNARESTKDKVKEANEIMDALGEWLDEDPATGFHLVKRPDGHILRIADLVEDDAAKRDKVIGALKDPTQRNNRDHVDIIIALGMAKEGFDWIWCEHALTVGYRASLTEIIQIIGRATRDAPGKTVARFSNLIAEPDASEDAVKDAINDTLKAIAASLLMEQVLAPRFNFTPKCSGAKEGFDYGEAGYRDDKANIGFNEKTGEYHIEIKGLAMPQSP